MNKQKKSLIINRLLASLMIFSGLEAGVTVAGYPDFETTNVPSIDYPTKDGISLFAPFGPPIDTNYVVHPVAPRITEWTRSNNPGDTMALTGENLSVNSDDKEGVDSRFVIYGEGMPVTDCFIQRLDGRECAISLPANSSSKTVLPTDEVYLLWPRNENGFGVPVPINQAEAWWVGFDKISRGDQFFVYGRNLILGDGDCHLFYTNEVSKTGGWLKSRSANPYKAAFEMPLDKPAGTYKIYVHNGHGLNYGWSESLSLEVKDPYVWSGNTYNLVTDFGANGADGQDDQAAFNACASAVSIHKGSTVIIPAGTYHLSGTFDLKSNTRFIGAGISNTILTATSSRTNTGDDIFIVGRENYIFKNMSIRLTDSLIKDAIRINEFWSKDVLFENIEIDDRLSPSSNHGALNMNKATRVWLKNCVFYHKNTINFGEAKQVRVENCQFIGIYDNNQLTTINSGAQVDISGCVARNLSMTDASSSFGWCKGRWIVDTGRSRDIYLGNNETRDLLPRNPTQFWQGGVVTAIGPYENEQTYFYGTMGEQVIRVGDIPDEYHEMGNDSIPWSGAKAVLVSSQGADEFLIRKTDAVNNTITIQLIDWRTPIVFEQGMTIGMKDITDQNASEQYLLEGNATRFEGKPVSVTPDELVFNTGNIDNLSACTVAHIVKGQGYGQSRRIASVDKANGKVKLVSPWKVQPTTDSIINMGGYAHRYIFYRNTFDGRPEGADPNGYSASAGMQSGGGSSDMVFVENTFNEVRQGLWFRSKGNFDTYPAVNVMSQNIFNHVEGNQFRNCMLDIALTDSSKNNMPIAETELTTVGNVFRNNNSQGAYKAFSITPTADDNAYWMRLNVYQDNVASDFTTSIYEEQGVVNQVWIGNTFSGNGSGYKIAEGHIPVLRQNTWNISSAPYSGNIDNVVFEVPIRTVQLNVLIPYIEIPVWNSGTGPLTWSIESVEPSGGLNWLNVTALSTDPLAADGGEGGVSLSLNDTPPTADTFAMVTLKATDSVGRIARKRLKIYYSHVEPVDDWVVEYDVTYAFDVQAVLRNITTEQEVLVEVLHNPDHYKLRIQRDLTSPGNTYQVILRKQSESNPDVWVDLPEKKPNFRM